MIFMVHIGLLSTAVLLAHCTRWSSIVAGCMVTIRHAESNFNAAILSLTACFTGL
jgi:hypothetical protein